MSGREMTPAELQDLHRRLLARDPAAIAQVLAAGRAAEEEEERAERGEEGVDG